MDLNKRVARNIILPGGLLLCCTPALAQSTSQAPRADTIRAENGSQSQSDDGSPLTTMEEELRKKQQIKFAEKEYRDNLARASEIGELGKGLATSFKRKKLLEREDFKKLDRLEKLTRKIRSEAGGEDGEPSLDKPPGDLDAGVLRLGEVAVSVGEKVKQTPRQVISAAVIDEANVLLELIRLVRSMAR